MMIGRMNKDNRIHSKEQKSIRQSSMNCWKLRKMQRLSRSKKHLERERSRSIPIKEEILISSNGLKKRMIHF